MRILLLQPGWGKGLGFNKMSLVEPLALETVAGGLEGHDVRLLDLRLEDRLVPTLKEFRPEVCGINCSFTVDVYSAISTASAVKAALPDAPPFVVVGGHHPTLTPGDFAHPAVDAVVIGEGETTISDLVGALAAGKSLEGVAGLALNRPEGQVLTDARPMAESLDDLPFPNRSLTARYRRSYYFFNQRHVAVVETARGCPYRCHFCAVWCFYKGTYRAHSPEHVAAEVARITEPRILFSDDNFLADPERAERIAHLLLRQGSDKHRYFCQARTDSVVAEPRLLELWQRVGLEGIQVGLEKTDDASLAGVNKHNSVANNEAALDIISRLNMGVMGSFITDPSWDHGDFQALRDYVESQQINVPSFLVLTPLPGTVLRRQLADQLVTRDYELYDLLHAVVPTRLPLDEFYRELASLYLVGYKPGRLTIETLRVIRSGNWLRPGGASHLWTIGMAAMRLSDPRRYLEGHQSSQQRTMPPGVSIGSSS